MISLTPDVEPHPFSQDEQQAFRTIADEFIRHYDIAEDHRVYREHMLSATPDSATPMICVDDFTTVSNLDGILGLNYYSSRAFTRARDGDMVAVTFPEIPGFIDYMDGMLNLGRPEHLEVRTQDEVPPYAIFRSLLSDEEALSHVVGQAKNAGRLYIMPFQGVPDAWAFAKVVSTRAGVPVQVASALPAVTAVANNKVRLLEVVRQLLGDNASVTARKGRTTEEIVNAMREMAEFAQSRIAVKLADSASSMGTALFSVQEIRYRNRSDLVRMISDWLAEKNWGEHTSPAVTIEVWEDHVLASPSAQLWIPPAGDSGADGPIVEGVFEQLFEDNAERTFRGSIPSTLPGHINMTVSDMAAQVGRVFQLMGYVGRCSFDMIVIGESPDDAEVKFVECNGRWGGTSTPMSYMNRIFGDWRRQPYVSANIHSVGLEGTKFSDLISDLQDVLYDAQKEAGYVIMNNVGCLAPTGKFELITIGETRDEAQARWDSIASRLGGK